jgi:hypothetical protein
MHARMAFVRRGNVKSERRDLAASGPVRAPQWWEVAGK